MSKRKRILTMLAQGGHSQSEVAAIVGCSKRDVSECARYLRSNTLSLEAIEAMSEAEAAALSQRSLGTKTSRIFKSTPQPSWSARKRTRGFP